MKKTIAYVRKDLTEAVEAFRKEYGAKFASDLLASFSKKGACDVCGEEREITERFCSEECAQIDWYDTEEAEATGN